MKAPTAADISNVMAELGKRGGRARVKSQTPEQRSDSARKAANTRWARRTMNAESKAMRQKGVVATLTALPKVAKPATTRRTKQK